MIYLRKYLLVIILTLWLVPSLLTINFECTERSYVNPPKPNFKSERSFDDVEQSFPTSFLTNEKSSQETNIPIKKPIPKITQEGEHLELKEFSEHYHYGNGTIAFSSKLGDQNTWDGNQYQYYVWNNIEKSIQYANSKVTFYDWYSVIEQDDKVIVDDSRWIVEYWREQGAGSWRQIDLYNHQWFDPIVETKKITFIQQYDDDVNYFNVSYIVTNNAAVKINIDYLAGEAREVRFVWQLTGMDGNIDYNQGKREFSFADIIISCNDTKLSTGFDYYWNVDNKKLDVRLGSFNVVADDVIAIDPTFSEKQSVDEYDLYVSDSTDYYWSDELYVHQVSGIYISVIAWDSGITDTIDSTSSAEMTFYCTADAIDPGDGVQFGLYDNLDVDEFWNETECDGDSGNGAWAQTTYWNDTDFGEFDGEGSANVTIGDAESGILIDNWVTHHNDAPSSRQFIPIKISAGDNMASADSVTLSESTEAVVGQRPTLTFTYTTGGGGNNAPNSPTLETDSGNTFACKSFEVVSNHTDDDGGADIEIMYLQHSDPGFNVTIYCFQNSSSGSVGVVNGSDYLNGTPTYVHSAITNGYMVNWTIIFDWDFIDDNAYTIFARTVDDEPEWSSWASLDVDNLFENDLEIVAFNVSILGSAEYGGSDGWIEDTDWFLGGVEVTANGTVEYEGSSQTFNSSYFAAISVELVFDSGNTGENDSIIILGVFSAITYTPTSASGIDTTAYFDAIINNIPNGTDVTGAGIEITSQRDNQNPTVSLAPMSDNASIGYAPNSYYDDDSTIDFNASSGSDGSGSGLPANCYSWNNTAFDGNTTKQYTGESDGNISVNLIITDNLGNNGSYDTWVIVDTDSPTGFTWTWTRVNGTYPCVQNSSGFYYDDSQNNYTTLTINDDGTIQNSAFWKIEWDKNSILEAAANDTSGLPDNKNFNYQGDNNGTFLIRVINNAGNYQTFTIECYDSYDSGGAANNVPVAIVDTAISGTLYAGIEFTFKTNHTDGDGEADLAFLFSGLGDDQFDITFNATAGEGSLSVTTENGTIYVLSINASSTNITNGYQVTWTVRLDWDWSTFDDSTTIDTWARSQDDEPEFSAWATNNSNADYENDLEIVGLNISIVGTAEYGGADGWIEDTDWFLGGVEITANGTVEYEGSSQTFNSSYADTVNITLFYDGVSTGQNDSIILSGVFSGVTYTPTSASGLDTTAYFDVQINNIPSGGSDVTGAGIEITSKRDNQDPTVSVSPDADSASIGYDPNTNYDDDSTIDFTASSGTDGSGSGLPANCYSWNSSAFESSTTKQYGGQSDGNISLNLIITDNLGNNGSYDTWVIVDTDSPTGFTITWTRVNGTYPIFVYDGNMTIYFDPGNECNNYTTLTINDDGSINNSAFWKVEFDKNSVFETAANDTSGLPDNKNFYYQGDTNGTFLIRIVNNAGNYQTFSYDAYDTLDGGCGEPPTTTAPSGGPSDTAGVIQEPPFRYSTQFAWYIWMAIWAGAGIIVTGAVLYYFMKQLL